jgi:hypothetical protein
MFKYLLFLVWILALAFFIHIEFGLVFTILSCLAFMCLNTSTDRSDIVASTPDGRYERHRASAYSVFNKKGERLAGDFNADIIDKQLRGGLFNNKG